MSSSASRPKRLPGGCRSAQTLGVKRSRSFRIRSQVMSVRVGSFFGLLLRKNARTRRIIIRHITGGLRDVATQGTRDRQEDEYLLWVPVAVKVQGLAEKVRVLEAAGLVHGRDFLKTFPPNGVNGPRPIWLSFELEPTGNPPELEAKMDPEVRGMWERNRKPLYFITPGYESDDA